MIIGSISIAALILILASALVHFFLHDMKYALTILQVIKIYFALNASKWYFLTFYYTISTHMIIHLITIFSKHCTAEFLKSVSLIYYGSLREPTTLHMFYHMLFYTFNQLFATITINVHSLISHKKCIRIQMKIPLMRR